MMNVLEVAHPYNLNLTMIKPKYIFNNISPFNSSTCIISIYAYIFCNHSSICNQTQNPLHPDYEKMTLIINPI